VPLLLEGKFPERLVHGPLVQTDLRRDFPITMEQTPIILSGPRGRASGIDQTTLGDHPPVLHLLGDQDFSNLRSCIHGQFSSVLLPNSGPGRQRFCQSLGQIVHLRPKIASRNRGDLHLYQRVLKVLELTFNSPANVLNASRKRVCVAPTNRT
jgi:hypothetical protein